MNAEELRATILLLLDEYHYADSTPYVNNTEANDTEIAAALGASIEDIRRQLDILAGQGLIITPVNMFTGQSAYITPEGIALAEELRKTAEGEPSKRPIGFD